MILYVHGFGSSGNSNKAQILRKSFPGVHVEAPDLPLEPNAVISKLKKIITGQNRPILIIGSSLGGFYATYIASRFDLRNILINPSVEPWLTLPENDNSYPEKYIEQLKEIDKKQKKSELNTVLTTVFLAKNDERLDYKLAKKKYKYAEVILRSSGGHQYINFKDDIDYIRKIYNEVASIDVNMLKENLSI